MDILNDYNLEEDAERGASYTLLDPRNGKELDIVFKLKGADSSTHDELLRIEQTKSMIDGDKYDSKSGVIRILAGLIYGWCNILDGENEFEYNQENAIILLIKKAWVREQLQNFIETRSNFFLD